MTITTDNREPIFASEMPEETHNPGPWVKAPSGCNGDGYQRITTQNDETICTLPPYHYIPNCQQADARLIASAPTLRAEVDRVKRDNAELTEKITQLEHDLLVLTQVSREDDVEIERRDELIASLKSENERLKQSRLLALEYGYKCCEQGMNIQATIQAYSNATGETS